VLLTLAVASVSFHLHSCPYSYASAQIPSKVADIFPAQQKNE
jgi:hypothetical protein